MFGTTDQADMQWNYGVYGTFESPSTMPEPGSLDEMAILRAKLVDHTETPIIPNHDLSEYPGYSRLLVEQYQHDARKNPLSDESLARVFSEVPQMSQPDLNFDVFSTVNTVEGEYGDDAVVNRGNYRQLEEIYPNNTSTSLLIPSSPRDDHPSISFEFETIARFDETRTSGFTAVPNEIPNFSAGHLKNIYFMQDVGRVAAVSLPIAHDHETPLPDGQIQEYASWRPLTEVHEELFSDGATADPPLADGNSDISRELQTERNIVDQPVVSSLRSSTSNPTSPSRNPARKRLHKCPKCTSFHDRPSRAQACLNRHRGAKPHVCEGKCGNTECVKSFASKDQLRSHATAPCPHCSTLITKGNIAKHRKTCSSHVASSVPGPSRTTRGSTRDRTSETPTPNATSQASQVAENEG